VLGGFQFSNVEQQNVSEKLDHEAYKSTLHKFTGSNSVREISEIA